MEQQKRSYCNCSVDGCSNSTLNSELSFFRLPNVSERRTEWLKLIQREELIDSNCLNVRVCEAHFSPNSIKTNSMRKLLKKNAIPQLLLPSQIKFANKGIQATIDTADANVQCDYDLQTTAQVKTKLQCSNNTSRKRKSLSEVLNCQKRLKLINNTQTEANTFLKLCDKFLTPNLSSIVKQQTKIKPGNMYNLDYKIFCLNLYYVSPEAYDLLKDTLSLPNKEKLMKMYMPVTTKIHSHLMDVLKTKVQNMSKMDRNCTVVVNTMNLKTNLIYNIKEDRIYGFHEVDGVQSPEPAKYALVAMINGLFDNYKQPVGLALLAECKNYPSLTDWIDKLILELFSIGLNVRSLVSDMGSGFLNSARKRSVSVESPYFFVGDKKIYYIFDPPHLMKLVRNNLINYEFHFENHVAKWPHIVQFYEMDKLRRLRLAPKLTDNHIKPTNLERMKVKYAVEVLSTTVAAGLFTHMSFGILENSALGTIKMIEIMNDLFDFLNTSSRYGSKQCQNAFCGEQYQIAYINSTLNFFASLKLINANNGLNVTSKVKFIEGFQITLKSLLMLFEDLRIEGISYIMTRKINKDCLENFFDEIRTTNGNPRETTSWQLVSAFRKIFLTNFLKSPKSGNYKLDLTKCLLDGEELYAAPLPNEEDNPETTSKMLSNREKNKNSATINLISSKDYNTLDLPEKNALVYVSGYLLRKCLDYHKECNERLVNTKDEEEDKEAHNFSQGYTFALYKAYCKDDTKTLLSIPPDSFVEFVRSVEERFCNYFKSNPLNSNPLKTLLNEMQTMSFATPCKCFPLDYCKKLFIRMRIYYTLKYNNRAFRKCRNRCKIFSVANL